jgi:DNA gyrase/topoisomerase IV subunit A
MKKKKTTQKEKLQKEVKRLNSLIKQFEVIYKNEEDKFIKIKERLSLKIEVYKSVIININ